MAASRHSSSQNLFLAERLVWRNPLTGTGRFEPVRSDAIQWSVIRDSAAGEMLRSTRVERIKTVGRGWYFATLSIRASGRR